MSSPERVQNPEFIGVIRWRRFRFGVPRHVGYKPLAMTTPSIGLESPSRAGRLAAGEYVDSRP